MRFTGTNVGRNKIPYRNNWMPTEKMVGLHNERALPPMNYY